MNDVRLLVLDEVTNRLSYSIVGQVNPLCAGALGAMQSVISLLMKTPGTDLTSPLQGGGLSAMVRQHRNDGVALRRDLMGRMSQVQEVVEQDQKFLQLGDDERIVAINLIDVKTGEELTDIQIEIGISFANGVMTRLPL